MGADLSQVEGAVAALAPYLERPCLVVGKSTVPVGTAERLATLLAELRDFVGTPYKHLSSGMKVRLAFAVISRLEEPILLVDEVLAVGDKAFRAKCYRRIDELLSAGRTLFFVSHNERDLKRFCTRGLYLDKGELKLDGPIGEVLAAYDADYGSVT